MISLGFEFICILVNARGKGKKNRNFEGILREGEAKCQFISFEQIQSENVISDVSCICIVNQATPSFLYSNCRSCLSLVS